jgi:hypothetical protein
MGLKFLSRFGFVSFITSTWNLDHGYVKFFPLRTSLLYVQVLFETGLLYFVSGAVQKKIRNVSSVPSILKSGDGNAQACFFWIIPRFVVDEDVSWRNFVAGDNQIFFSALYFCSILTKFEFSRDAVIIAQQVSIWYMRTDRRTYMTNLVDEIWALLGHYAASSGNSLQTFRNKLSIPFSRIKKSKENFLGFLGFCDPWRWDQNLSRKVGKELSLYAA